MPRSGREPQACGTAGCNESSGLGVLWGGTSRSTRSHGMKRIPILLLFLFLAAAGRAAAQDADVLTGRVVGTDGHVVSGARVEAIQVESEITHSVLTNDQGRYLILFPDGTGNYVIRV